MATDWASNVLRGAAAIAPGERLLVVVDPPLANAGAELCDAAGRLTKGRAVCHVLPSSAKPAMDQSLSRRSFVVVPTSLADQAARADVLIVLRSGTGTTDESPRMRALLAAAQQAGRARVLTAGFVNDAVLHEECSADFAAVDAAVHRLRQTVTELDDVRLLTDAGSDLRFSVGGRPWVLDRGVVRAPGDRSNLPGGEIFIAPIETSAEGCLVVDVAAGAITARQPIRLWFTRGRVERIEGGAEAELLKRRLGADPSAWTIGEWGIGANPFAQIRGHAAIDEKVAGTMHIALGANLSFGGQNAANSHVDCVFKGGWGGSVGV